MVIQFQGLEPVSKLRASAENDQGYACLVIIIVLCPFEENAGTNPIPILLASIWNSRVKDVSAVWTIDDTDRLAKEMEPQSY